MLLKRNGTLVGMPEGAFMRFIGAKKAGYTCPMASTRNSFLRGAGPGSGGVGGDEAIPSSIAKRSDALFRHKKRGAQDAPLEKFDLTCRSARRWRFAAERSAANACLREDAHCSPWKSRPDLRRSPCLSGLLP